MYPFWKYALHRRLPRLHILDEDMAGRMGRMFAHASVRNWYVFGLRLVRIWTFPRLRSVEIFGLPLIQIRQHACKTCWCLGPFEILKLRVSGPRSGISQTGPLCLGHARDSRRRLYWNIGPLAFSDEVSGVPRVARSLLHSLMTMPDSGYDVCPVYTAADMAGYVHARSFLRKMEGDEEGAALDEPVIFRDGDMLLSPVPDVREVETHMETLKSLRASGVRVLFMVHDLIPLQHPEFCPSSFRNEFARWLPMVSHFDGILTVSRTVAGDYRRWREKHMPKTGPFFLGWFHLGSDMEKRFPSRGMPDNAPVVLAAMKARPTFLSVSTLEPRKGYRQSLAAFERLWAGNIDVNFVIVGRQGWNTGDLAGKMERHPENGRRLFWLRGISDEFLDKLYAASDCVLFASEAEGFGLAVVEGAEHGKPLILRDIPVFREIAGDHAVYFSGSSAEDLADCLEAWLHRRKNGAVTGSEHIHALSWDESARMLLSRLDEI